MYKNKSAIATAGNTRQDRGTRSEGRYEAENNIKYEAEIIIEVSYWNNTVIEDESTANCSQFGNS